MKLSLINETPVKQHYDDTGHQYWAASNKSGYRHYHKPQPKRIIADTEPDERQTEALHLAKRIADNGNKLLDISQGDLSDPLLYSQVITKLTYLRLLIDRLADRTDEPEMLNLYHDKIAQVHDTINGLDDETIDNSDQSQLIADAIDDLVTHLEALPRDIIKSGYFNNEMPEHIRATQDLQDLKASIKFKPNKNIQALNRTQLLDYLQRTNATLDIPFTDKPIDEWISIYNTSMHAALVIATNEKIKPAIWYRLAKEFQDYYLEADSARSYTAQIRKKPHDETIQAKLRWTNSRLQHAGQHLKKLLQDAGI